MAAKPSNGVRFTVDGRNFSAGVQTARKLRGYFDGETKTWLIPAEMVEFVGRPGYGYLVKVGQPSAARPMPKTAAEMERTMCPLWTRDEGCAAHGEHCRDTYLRAR